jgi:hypothetical protein
VLSIRQFYTYFVNTQCALIPRSFRYITGIKNSKSSNGKAIVRRLLSYIFIAAIVAVATHGFAASTTEVLPNFELFAASLPKYDYDCDIQAYYSEPGLQAAMHVTRVPTYQQFNSQFSKTIPELFYKSLTELSILNNSLAMEIYHNLKREPLRFECSHTISKWSAGSVAYTRRKWFIFGEKIINLGAYVTSLINRNEGEIIYFNRSILHETLHNFILDGQFLDHASDTIKTGGKNDVIYSCANFVWRPTNVSNQPINANSSNELRKTLAAYTPYSRNVSTYLKQISNTKQIKSIEDDVRVHPQRLLLDVFNYDQCMTCALTRVTNGFVYRGGTSQETRQADEFCSVIAPKITIH